MAKVRIKSEKLIPFGGIFAIMELLKNFRWQNIQRTIAATKKKGSRDRYLDSFANIGQWWRNGEAKPQKWSDAFTYGIWLYTAE